VLIVNGVKAIGVELDKLVIEMLAAGTGVAGAELLLLLHPEMKTVPTRRILATRDLKFITHPFKRKHERTIPGLSWLTKGVEGCG
jgi:hypothetical protein